MNNSWRKKMEMSTKKNPGITGLATTAIFNTKFSGIENKIIDVSIVNQSKNQIMTLKYNKLKENLINADYNKFTSETLDAKIKKVVGEYDISGLVNNTDLNTTLSTLATKAELKAEQDQIVKL